MKKYLIFCLFCCSFSVSAQLNPAWINHFCCFDSIAPHSFSYPLGIIQSGDSMIIAYVEDDSVKIKVIDMFSGNDIANFNYGSDTISSPAYVNGSFMKTDSGYLGSCFSYRSNGSLPDGWWLIIYSFDNNFNLQNKNQVNVVDIGIPTNLVYSPFDSTYYFADFNQLDSLTLYNIDRNANLLRSFKYGLNNRQDIAGGLFFASDGTLISVERLEQNPAPEYVVSLRKIDLVTGLELSNVNIDSSLGITHVFYQHNDTLAIAFNGHDNGGLVKFTKVSLINFSYNSYSTANIYQVGGLWNFEFESNSGNSYIEGGSQLIQIKPDNSVGFVKSVIYPSYMLYNKSPILFDINGNPIIFRSYINNTISNQDLLMQRFNNVTGETIDSMFYNDIRNTPDFAITQFIDYSGGLNLIFANDYDNAFILQEETQLNVIHISTLSDSQPELMSQTVTIFPNPTTGNLNLKCESVIIDELKIFDFTGKYLRTIKLNSSNSFSVSDLISGIYVIRAISKNGDQMNIKIIKVAP